jgi:translation initiation factor 2 subunit 1
MAKEMPEIGEVVVVKVTKVLNYGVFADLLEYEGSTGFVHISQVASSWIKNIRNFVKENQIRAAKVLRIDQQKQQIDLSLEKVPARAQRRKIEEWKQLKRGQKLIELMAKEQKKTFDQAWQEVAEPLMDEYDSLYVAFEAIALDGESAAKGVPKAWVKPLVSMVSKNIAVPRKTLKGTIELHSFDPDGVEVLKKTLAKAKTEVGKEEISLTYQGSNKFLVKVTSSDFKAAEKALNAFGETAVKLIEKAKGKGEFKLLEKA